MEIPIVVDRGLSGPLREQVVVQLRDAIRGGLLQAGYPLPSTRTLATETGVSRSIIIAAYLELEGEGWVQGSQGAGTFVAHREDPRRQRVAEADRAHSEQPRVLDLRPGDLDPSLIDSTQWRAAWRRVRPSSGPPPAPGTDELRTAIAAYLGAARGLQCVAEDIIVCAGTAEAMVLLGLTFGWAGKTVAVEDPGYPAIRRVLTRTGVSWVPVDASEPARLVDNLAGVRDAPAAMYVTPSHQYPLGGRLDTHTRRELLSWADRRAAVIVEDDYDAEFRFGVPPLQSLASLDHDASVIFMGTVSKVLDPGLRLTYLRAPRHLRQLILETRTDLGSTVATPVQAVVTDLLTSGVLTRHIARVRKVYADRRQVMLRALESLVTVRGLRGIDAGLHLVADLEGTPNVQMIAEAARQRGVSIAALDEFRAKPDPEHPALVLGYAKVTPAEIRTAVAVLADVLRQAR